MHRGDLDNYVNPSGTATTINGDEPRGLSTAPVFLASICTVLGAIMFLRFGYAVGHVGALGTLSIIILGHMVTVPTALAIAEIATNRRVEGGGEYFIISRSFGTTIGGTIGASLYLSQAISVAFYMIAFAEAFRPLGPWFTSVTGLPFDPRWLSVPGTLLLLALVLSRGVKLGVAALWVVAVILALALLLFFVGAPMEDAGRATRLADHIPDADPFMVVFAIVFPAFTGMTAGVGLSGDLENPRRSLPLGILLATGVGFVVYIAEVIKLTISASPEALASDPLVMSRIAVWGPIIPIGLAAATLSSAIGSILVAPRTLQAMARDRVVPLTRANRFLGRGRGEAGEPFNATLVTGTLALVTVLLGDVNFVARIISMFFMMTYGALCSISFLEHFAARPSFRPSFRSKWYISLLGALSCFLLMFQMDPLYAVLALTIMGIIYGTIQATREGRSDDLAVIVRGALTQATRHMQISLQRDTARTYHGDWRPSIIMVDGRTFDRSVPLQFLSWLCQRYGFGTYLHYIKGQLDTNTYRESRVVLGDLIRSIEFKKSAVYVDTMISPSYRSALAQSLQVPGVSGMENNTILFECSVHDEESILHEIRDGSALAAATGMNSLVLRHGDHFFGDRTSIHVWITWHDYQNANLMILLSYILLGHPDWHKAEITIFAAFPHEQAKEQRVKLHELITAGRIPVTPRKIRILPTGEQADFQQLVENRSAGADLVILGFTNARLEEKGIELFQRHPRLKDTLWVSAQERILIE